MPEHDDLRRIRRPQHDVEEPTAARRTTVGPADDRYERQADQVAARVLATLSVGQAAPPAATLDGSTRVQRTTVRAATAPAASRGRVQRRSGVGGIGPEGGEIDAETEARLDRTSGAGAPLAPDVRRSMEHGFGNADFGNVKLHTGAESAELNERLGAQAFTLGSDIYLGRGTPALDTGPGQGLLAHELAHTMQQGDSAQRRIRRLAYNKPIKNVVSIDVMQGGGGGRTAKVSDGASSVIVKSDQVNAAEVIAADKMIRAADSKSGGYKIKAPKSRIASASDLAELRAKANAPGVLTGLPREFVTGLEEGKQPTIIAEAVSGETLLAQQERAVTKTDDGGYTRDEASVSAIKKLLSSTAAIKAIGKSTASDVVMGMGDRFIGAFNPENFLFDAKSKRFSYIDNTAKSSEGALVSKVLADGLDNARYGFNAWAKLHYIQDLISAPEELALTLVKNYTGIDAKGRATTWGVAGFFYESKKSEREKDNDKNKLFVELSAIVKANYTSLVTAATAGLTAGLAPVLKQLADPLALTKGLPENMRLDAVTSLLARRAVLKGAASPDAAWEAANAQAHKLLKLKFKPAVPALSMFEFKGHLDKLN
jgi:hypothetical protein